MLTSVALLACLLAASPAFAAHGKKKTLKGYLVDITCINERAKELPTLGTVHTKKCLQMPDCERSGYAVLTPDRKVIKFDAAGNEEAKKLIAASSRQKDFQISVTGRLQNDLMTVITMKEIE